EQNRQIVEVEEERNRLFKQLNFDDKDRINGVYKKFRSSMPTRIDDLRLVQPMLSNIEHRLKQIELYIQNDEKSELHRMPIRERSEYFQQAELLLDSIEDKHFDVVNTGPLRLSLTSLRSGFELPSTDVTDYLETELTAKKSVSSLRDRFEPTSPRIGSRSPTMVDRVADLLDRKRKIIDRREDTSEAARASLLEMKMVNEALVVHNASNHPLNPPMENDWKKKSIILENLVSLDSEVDRLHQKLKNVENHEEFVLIGHDSETIMKNLDELGTDLPLSSEIKRRAFQIRKAAGNKQNHVKKLTFETIERKIKEMEYVPEEDVAIAEIIVKKFVGGNK
uniref:Uncharacterized protein n=1 Tax=Panagrolaimus sp. JU765 TaxID=591449 RepID=A0AC34RQB5_9BILA